MIFKNIKGKYKIIFILVGIALATIISLSGAISRKINTTYFSDDEINITNWEFIATENMSPIDISKIISGEKEVDWQNFNAPGTPKNTYSNKTFIIRTNLPNLAFKNPTLRVEMYDHVFRVYQNNKEIYNYGVENDTFVNDMVGNTINFIPVSTNSENNWVYFEGLCLIPDRTGYVKQAVFGEMSSLTLSIAREGFVRFAISLLLVVAGISMLLFSNWKEGLDFFQLGLFSIFIGLWFCFDSNRALSLVEINPLIAQYIGLLSMYFAPIPFAFFSGASIKSKTSILMRLFGWAYFLYFIVVCVLDSFFGIRLLSTLYIYHFISILFIIAVSIHAFMALKHKNSASKIFAFAILFIASVVLTETFGFIFRIAILQMGYVSYALVIFIGIITNIPINRVKLLNEQVAEYSNELARNSITLQKIIIALSKVLEKQTNESMIFMILKQLIDILDLESESNQISSLICISQDGEMKTISSTGNCNPSDIDILLKNNPFGGKQIVFENGKIAMYFTHDNTLDCIILVKDINLLSHNAKQFVEIYFTCILAAYNNLRLNRDIISSQENIIYALGNITEERSHHTGQHIQRVAQYSKLLAIKYGLSERDAEIVKIASVMHDIGKLGIPDDILNKPGKLTNEEFERMKDHAKIGFEMLSNSNLELIKASSLIALQHHEKYNGKGYYGIEGENIDLFARIVAIADVFDALLTERPYKKAWSLDDAISYFKEESGNHFDPKLVEIFLNNINELNKIRLNLADKL